jgi:hypothetical protein
VAGDLATWYCVVLDKKGPVPQGLANTTFDLTVVLFSPFCSAGSMTVRDSS